MRCLRWVLSLGLAGCASAFATSDEHAALPRSAGAEREVIAVAETLFSAMRTRDTTAIRSLFLPEVQIVSLREGASSGTAPQRRSVSDFVSSIARPGDELRERMWDPRVEVSGDLATLWAPYDFHVGERFSHCGYDAFHLLRQDGIWRIAALTYTVQTTGCPTDR